MKTKSNLYVVKTSSFHIINYNYLLLDNSTKEMILIDPAWEFGTLTQAMRNVDGHLKAVLLTHSHIDHTNLADRFAKEFHVDVYMSKKEIEEYHFQCKNLRALRNYEVVQFGETQIECLDTPGHTAGSMCFLSDGRVYTGDTVFTEGCGMCSTPGGSVEAMYQSIQKLKEVVDDKWKVYPSHSYGKSVGCTMDYIKKNNIYFNLNDKKKFIDFRMRPNQKRLFDFK